MNSAGANEASTFTAIEVALAPAHRNLMKRRELAETLGLFSLNSKLIGCPTCGADVPDHAFQYHVSFHPVCPGCKAAFISDFVLDIHRAIDCTNSSDKPKSKGKRKLASTLTAKAQKEPKKGGKKEKANNNNRTNTSPVQIVVSPGGASELFQSSAVSNIPGNQNDAAIPSTADPVHTNVTSLAKKDDSKDTVRDEDSSLYSEREEEEERVGNKVGSEGGMTGNGLEESSDSKEIDSGGRMEVKFESGEPPFFDLSDAKYSQEKKRWRIRAEQLRRGRETKYFRELQHVLGIPFIPGQGYREPDDDKRPSISRPKLLKHAKEVIAMLKAIEESLLQDKKAEWEKKIVLEELVEDLRTNSRTNFLSITTAPRTSTTNTSSKAPNKVEDLKLNSRTTTALTKLAIKTFSKAPTTATTRTSSKALTTADLWKRAATGMNGGSDSHWFIDAKPNTSTVATQRFQPPELHSRAVVTELPNFGNGQANDVNRGIVEPCELNQLTSQVAKPVESHSSDLADRWTIEDVVESTDQVGVMSVDVEDAIDADGQVTDQADASIFAVDDKLCLNEGEDLNIDVEDKPDRSVDLSMEVDEAYLEGLNDAEFINDSIGEDATSS